MKVEIRKRANGSEYFSFVYWDGKRRVRLKQTTHPKFNSIEDAKQWAKAKVAEVDCARARVLRRLQWKTQYYEFTKLADGYIEHCKKTQPNSWKNTVLYLTHYVLPYFLDERKSNNPNSWSFYFEDFKKWLEDTALTIKQPQRPIAYSTKNHCIKTLNTFLEYLARNHLMDRANSGKMQGFSSNMINSRDAEALITPEEFKAVFNNLQELNPLVAVFFQTAYYTGMRFNEIYGISLDDLFNGEIEDEFLKKALDDYKIKHFGYVVLESQPATKIRARLPDGSIKRKPLKGKRKIHEKHTRIMPIINKDLFNNLVKLYKQQKELLEKRSYGRNPKDYVLFDGLTTTAASIVLRAAYSKTKYTPKSYHCCRHTRCTELVGLTRDVALAKSWLGHERHETTLRYTHIHQKASRTARKKEQNIEFIE